MIPPLAATQFHTSVANPPLKQLSPNRTQTSVLSGAPFMQLSTCKGKPSTTPNPCCRVPTVARRTGLNTAPFHTKYELHCLCCAARMSHEPAQIGHLLFAEVQRVHVAVLVFDHHCLEESHRCKVPAQRCAQA